MHCRLVTILVLVMVLGCAAAGAAGVPSPPKADARGHLLIDMHSARVLSEDGADEPLEPASLTKMLTSYVVFAEMAQGKFELSDEVLVSEKAWRMQGSRTFIEVGTRVSVEVLLKGLIVQSGNDAAVALAEFVAGDEQAFADLMNRYARQLGMSGSHFTNAPTFLFLSLFPSNLIPISSTFLPFTIPFLSLPPPHHLYLPAPPLSPSPHRHTPLP